MTEERHMQRARELFAEIRKQWGGNETLVSCITKVAAALAKAERKGAEAEREACAQEGGRRAASAKGAITRAAFEGYSAAIRARKP